MTLLGMKRVLKETRQGGPEVVRPSKLYLVALVALVASKENSKNLCLKGQRLVTSWFPTG